MATRITLTIAARDRIAAGLMLVCGLGALYAFVTAVGAVLTADAAIQQVEAWRMMGFLFFIVLFLLLAFWPRRYPYLWELLILSKGLLTLIEVLLARTGAPNALSSAIADGILTCVLIGAYVLSRGYSSWSQRQG